MKNFFKKLFAFFWKFALSMIVIVVCIYAWVDFRTEDYLYSSVDQVPPNRVGILLGTSKYVPDGGINLYYKYRIDAAVDLYKKNKIRKIIASGDNGTVYYNEPIKMKQDLMVRGVLDSDIVLDYAGFRTLDAMVRAKKVFSQDSFIVISQGFHNSRAVYIARANDIEASGYNAKDVEINGTLTHLREYLARVKMFFDLYVLHTEPKFLGEKVDV